MKMPHLPSLVGGAFFCACSRNSPSNAKRWGADSGPSVRVRPTSGDILKHIRTDVAFPVGGMTEEKTYSGMNLCRESIGNYVMAFCKENGLGHELVDRSPSCKRVIFGKVGGVSATVDLFLNNNGTTTVHYKIGKNQELGLLLAEYLKGTIDPAEFETVNLVLTSIFDDDVDLVFSGIDRQDFSVNEKSRRDSSVCWEIISTQFSDRLVVTYHASTHKLQLQGRPLSCYKAFVYCLAEVLDKTGLEKVLTRCGDDDHRVSYVQESVAETGLKAVMGNAYEKMDDVSKRLLLSGLCVKLASPELPDYSLLLYPELRVLEGAMKRLLSKLGINVQYESVGRAFEKVDGVYVLTVPADPRERAALEKGYCFYRKERHTLFHSNIVPVMNRVISTLSEMNRLSSECQKVIKNIYELI